LSKRTIHPAKVVSGGVVPPGDKSISHRYAMLSGIAEGTTEMSNFALAADCHSTLGCMRALGAEVKVEKNFVRVTGRGLRGLQASKRSLDAGNSGTTIRLLSGILAGQNFTTKIAGDDSLNKRPMKRILTPLREMGAQITARDENFAPLEIRGGKLRGIHYEMPMASAQVKSAVLLAGLFAEGDTTVIEPARTRDHTELALEEFGVPVERQGRTIRLHANGAIKLTGRKIEVPGDLSSAVFFVAAASLFPESSLHIQGV
jgi:3-phosphoshikimate 1-carboxyvinyltransferase